MTLTVTTSEIADFQTRTSLLGHPRSTRSVHLVLRGWPDEGPHTQCEGWALQLDALGGLSWEIFGFGGLCCPPGVERPQVPKSVIFCPVRFELLR